MNNILNTILFVLIFIKILYFILFFNSFVPKFIIFVLIFITYIFEVIRTINPNSNNINSFKYAISISLHYNDIPNKPQRISNLNKCESQYNFSCIKPIQFERNNPNITLYIHKTQNEQIYSSINNSQNKANIIHINDKYAAVKPYKNKLNELLKSLNRTELKDYVLNKIIVN